MGWINTWWGEIGLIGQIMACAAVPATIVLLLQLILAVIGLGSDGECFDSGGQDADFDTDIDTDLDSDFDVDTDMDGTDFEHGAGHDHYHGGLKLFTVRGITAFFAIGGWAGLAALTAEIPVLWAVQLALLAGVAAMLFASFAIRLALRMQSSGNIDPRNALSRTATVYITIPPSRADTGRVMLVLQERFVEMEAVTDCGTALKPKETVEVVGLEAGKLVVRPIGEVDAAVAAPDKDIEMGGKK